MSDLNNEFLIVETVGSERKRICQFRANQRIADCYRSGDKARQAITFKQDVELEVTEIFTEDRQWKVQTYDLNSAKAIIKHTKQYTDSWYVRLYRWLFRKQTMQLPKMKDVSKKEI